MGCSETALCPGNGGLRDGPLHVQWDAQRRPTALAMGCLETARCLGNGTLRDCPMSGQWNAQRRPAAWATALGAKFRGGSKAGV
ncbi:hypothetical protein AVEN_225606-1 [Araneus ventricosus]|uniref:Uncharacterized protein n=1 Tax=Araneus ventricosus TaxID=182803 RepID=A0A4Y2EZ16_ARAVE|nr:hypothetical protein AVEN_225606-1 [Araneus ventricosus]